MADQPADAARRGWHCTQPRSGCIMMTWSMVMFSFQHLFTIGSSLCHHFIHFSFHHHWFIMFRHCLIINFVVVGNQAISLIHHSFIIVSCLSHVCLIMSYFCSSRSERGSERRLFLLQQARLSMQKRLKNCAQKPRFFS